MYDDELKHLLKLIDEFNERYKEEQEKAPYNLCLLDLCGANENAHTKILLQLLKYRVNESYPFLESLLERWFRNKNLKFNYKELEISFNKDFIDGLIKDDQKAVIIENKIHYAPDQNQQIKGYVEKVEGKFRIDRNNIYVVYLTRYGDKKVTDNSCPKDLKEKLGGFVESNYCYDILPWLKEDVLPKTCPSPIFACISTLEFFINAKRSLSCSANFFTDSLSLSTASAPCSAPLTSSPWFGILGISAPVSDVELSPDFIAYALLNTSVSFNAFIISAIL
jgi:hypothetical protein